MERFKNYAILSLTIAVLVFPSTTQVKRKRIRLSFHRE